MKHAFARHTKREQYYRPVHHIRPKAFDLHRANKAWYDTIYAYLIPLVLLGMIAAVYYGS